MTKKRSVFLRISICIILLMSQNLIFASEFEIDEISTSDDDIQDIIEGIDSFTTGFIDKQSNKRTKKIMDGEMAVTPLSGDIISFNMTSSDPIELLVSGRLLYDDIYSKSYESLTESGQLVILEKINGRMQVGSISELENSKTGYSLSVDIDKVAKVASANEFNLDDIMYYKSELFNISLVSFENEATFLVFYDINLLNVPGVESGVLYSRENLVYLFEPLIEANKIFFEEFDENSQILYSGVTYDYSPNTLEKESSIGGIYIPNASKIVFITSLLFAGLFWIVAKRNDSRKDDIK